MTNTSTNKLLVKQTWINSDMGYIVYLHTNKANGKKYVGITSQKTAKRRWHNGEGYNQQRRFYNAIKHYGWDGFEHEVLFMGLTKKQAEAKEEELIKFYRSNEETFGYNIENGGRTHRMSESQKRRLSEVNTGRKHTEETKRKMSESHIGLSREWLTGRKASQETRNKMSLHRTGERNGRAKAVLQISEDGTILNRYATLKEAAVSVGACGSAHISNCCRGIKEFAHGFRWQYAEV